MRISEYLIIKKHEVKDCYIAINSISGNIDYLSNQVAKKIKNKDFLKFTEKEMQYLEQRGYIFPDDFDQKAQVKKIADIIHEKHLSTYKLSISPTLSCNFACPYCFECQISEEVKTQTLSLADVDEIFEAVDNADRPFSSEVFLFGGEPLMKKNLEVLTYIIEKCKERGMCLYGPTNGYELEAFKALLGSNMINNLQISIDGLYDEHDETRKHKNGDKTFARIVDNIDYCLENDVRIIARSNLSVNNVHRAKELIDFYEKKEWLSNKNFTFSFSPVMYASDSLSYTQFYRKLHKSGIPEEVLLSHVSQFLGITNKLNSLINQDQLIIFQPEMCTACYNGFFVLPNRKLFPCGDMFQTDQHCGVLSDGRFEFNEVRDEWNSRYIANVEKCSNCNYSLYCGGGCPVRCMRKKSPIHTSMCFNFPKVFDKCLSNLCNDKIAYHI